MPATASVQTMCSLLGKHRLLPADDVKALQHRWAATPAPDDAEKFRRWLVEQRICTEYQAWLLAHGRDEGYFIDDYKLLDRRGQGRMAGVYRAASPRGESVALKVLPPSRAGDPVYLARFQRESKMALLLKHPNVVRTYAVGESTGIRYMVMEFLDGETLEEVLKRRGKLPVAEAVRVVHQALLGLQHIYETGLVHRDLKPSNLMLLSGTSDTTLGAMVKILDIGLGRPTMAEVPKEKQETQLTGEGMLLGTPDYLAPEQARDARSVDIRADIYSLGCVLYHALAGRPPFPDTNVLNQMIRHAKEQSAPLREFNPDVPDGLQQIVNFMTAKEAGQRYPTPDRAAAALQMFLPAAPLEASPVSKEPNPPPSAPGDIPVGKLVGGPAKPAGKPAARPAETKPEPAKPARPTKRPPPVPTVAVPIIPAPPPAPAPAGDYDVELVPVPLPAVKPPSDKRPLYDMDRRDFIMLGSGIAGTLMAILAAIGLAKALRKKPAE